MPASVSWATLCDHYLSRHLYDSAKFYAERQHYENPSAKSLLTLAQCYYRLGKVKQTYLILQESIYSACDDAKYLFALVCLSLGKLQEAESVLTAEHSETFFAKELALTPGGAAGVHLLGKVCRRQQRIDHAKRYFLAALELDPFLWEAIVDLSEIGLDEPMDQVLSSLHDVQTVPSKEEEVLASSPASSAPVHALHSPAPSQSYKNIQRTYQLVEQLGTNEDGTPRTAVALGLSTMSIAPPHSTLSHSAPSSAASLSDSARHGGTSGMHPYTPTMPSPITRSMLTASGQSTYQHMYALGASQGSGPRKPDPRTLFGATPASQFSGLQHSGVLPGLQSTFHSDVPTHSKRVSFGIVPSTRLSFSGALDHETERASRLDASMYSPIYEQPDSFSDPQAPPSSSSSAPAAGPGPVPSVGAAHVQPPLEPPLLSTSAQALRNIVLLFARAVQFLHNYQSLECIETLQSLPTRHLQSGLTCQLLGKAYFDMNDYKVAVLVYRNMLQYEPFRVTGLDYYSTALWHLKKNKELAALATQTYDIDKYAPETYCTLGNFFSLAKDTDVAIKHFTRAMALSRFGPYAYTLAGHEFIYNDNLEQAVHHFNQALLVNPRHYNAWYGLGSIHYKQEKYELAEYYFTKARAINSRSSVLDCYVAMALHAQGTAEKITQSLQVLEEAIVRDPCNPQLRFQRAHILLSQDFIQEALEELLVVETFAPQEPPVHALLGQVYLRLDRMQDALMHLNIAMDLDPKEVTALKAILDGFEEPASTV